MLNDRSVLVSALYLCRFFSVLRIHLIIGQFLKFRLFSGFHWSLSASKSRMTSQMTNVYFVNTSAI